MKILILGSTGMLGNAVAKYFSQNTNHKIYLTHRNDLVKLDINSILFDPTIDDLQILPEVDYVINCIGVIKPFAEKNVKNTITLNSLFPRLLADYCQINKQKLIHVTTDCVYSGNDGNYDEKSLHDCTDIYGKTKSLGEPGNCMVLRTSIIGDEIHNNASLIAWVKSNKNGTVNGYENHIWNGVTTEQYAKICEEIIDNNLYREDLFHVFSNVVTKYDLLHMINKHYDLNIKINKVNDKYTIKRSLSTVKKLNNVLNIPSLDKQIESIASKNTLQPTTQVVS
jgi:dTDP-4-dehydrorhamnose reductase